MVIHVYCVAGFKIEYSLGRIGVGGFEVYTINYKDLAAFVSDAPEKYDLVGDMRAHELTIERLMEKYTIVPLRFGQLAKGKEEVKGFLVENYGLLKTLLARLEGKVELNLKLFWRLDEALAKLSSEKLTVRVLAKQIAGLPQGRVYPLKIKLGQLVERELAGLREKIVKEAYSNLKPLSLDVRENELLTKEMVWNAAFLIDSSVEEKFDKAVEGLEGKYGQLLSFRYVRSPPYSFTTVQIGG